MKAGKPANLEKWTIIKDAMEEAGCDKVILGCTELSVVRQELGLGDECIDSLWFLQKQQLKNAVTPLKSE